MKVVESSAESTNSKNNDVSVTTIEQQDLPTQNSLTVNKRFVVNTLKQVDDHNRIKTNQHSKLLRKFQNEERKKHTLKNLKKFSPQKTLYSDFFQVSQGNKKTQGHGRTKIITPLEQVKKLILGTPDFDLGQVQEHRLQGRKMLRVVRKQKSRISIDKRLLNNHLKHHSVHNRLKEEKEMWEKHKTQKEVVGLQTKSSKKRSRVSRGRFGGMYADREPGNVKITRVKETPDDSPSFGPATRQLLDLEESMPDRWGHSGFRETYVDESTDIEEDDDYPKTNSSRKIIISSITDRLNNSIELSDDDVEVLPTAKSRKLGSRVVVNKLNRKTKMNSRETTIDEPIFVGKSVVTKKRSIVKVAPKTNKPMQIEKPRANPNLIKPGRRKGSETFAKKRKLGTLQADLILSEEKNRKMLKRVGSPRWGHDGFEEIHVDEVEPMKKSVKDRLNVVSSTDCDADSVASIDFPQRNLGDEVSKKTNNSINVISQGENSKVQMSIHSSDSDEWTEKEVGNSLPKNDARRKLKQKTDESAVNRVTLKNSIHEGESGKSSRTLSTAQRAKNVGNVREVINNDKRKLDVRVDKKKAAGEDENDSSFTDSSSDERYKKEMGDKKRRVMRNRKFYNDRR